MSDTLTNPPAADDAPVTDDAPRPAPGGPPPWRRRPRWRVVAIAVLAGLVVLPVLDSLLGSLVQRSRQGQLAADFRKARNFTAAGRALAVLQVPRLELNVVVAEGLSPSTLRGGPGHLASSAVPGAPGNAVVMGHDGRYGGPFGRLDELRPGDKVYVQPKGSPDVVEYSVTGRDEVGGDTAALLAPTDGVRLTLVTRSGNRPGSRYLVVTAEAAGAARRTPAATREAAPPSSIPPNRAPLSPSVLLALGWFAVTALIRMRASFLPLRVRTAVAVPPLLLAAGLLWFEFDRLLPFLA